MSAFLSRVFGGAPPPPPPPPAFAAVAPSLALAALAGSALGFVRPVWFISVGEWGWGAGAALNPGQTDGGDGETCHMPTVRRHPQRTHPLPFSPSFPSLPPGYGLACIFQVAVAGRALAASGGVTGAARCGVAAFAAHGAWMALFLAARDYGLTTYRCVTRG